jgi:hypothetical protein
MRIFGITRDEVTVKGREESGEGSRRNEKRVIHNLNLSSDIVMLGV